MMARNGAYGDETPPEGIPVAMGVLRNGPIDSDDDEPANKPKTRRRDGDLLADDGEPRDSEADDLDNAGAEQPFSDAGPSRDSVGLRSRAASGASPSTAPVLDIPGIPRKSSKRVSALIDTSFAPSLDPLDSHSSVSGQSQGSGYKKSTHQHNLSVGSRLPFERSDSQKRLSTKSSTAFSGDLQPSDDGDLPPPRSSSGSAAREERPASFGMVPQHGISRVDPVHRSVDLLGSAAELVDGGSSRESSRGGPT
jgi:hypothetical protein